MFKIRRKRKKKRINTRFHYVALTGERSGRTTVLAQRWRYFRMFNLILDFDASPVVCELGNRKRSLESERKRFVGWVNLNLHSTATIDFTFPNICHPTERLRCLPLGLSTYESLVSPCLTEVDVTGEVIELFISNRPFLEKLRKKDADGLESSRPNLILYTCCGGIIAMALKNVSSLINLSLGAIMPCALSTYFLNLGELEFPNLPKLKKLVIDIQACGHGSLLCFTSLINAAPLLCEIVLNDFVDKNLIEMEKLKLATFHKFAKKEKVLSMMRVLDIPQVIDRERRFMKAFQCRDLDLKRICRHFSNENTVSRNGIYILSINSSSKFHIFYKK
ncbi:hypothetical protein Pfo_020717 [Paulownia fortunei]|nr:hypothetical protein Pfo_020717 [Paulownia fortunei]